MRTSPRTKSSTLWDNSPANTSLGVPDHPLTGITSTPTGLPQSENLHPLEESFRTPREANTGRKHKKWGFPPGVTPREPPREK